MAAVLLQGCQSTTAETATPPVINAELMCEPVLHISIGDEEGEFGLFPEEEPMNQPPQRIVVDENSHIYLEDQANSRIFVYSENGEGLSVINIPSYEVETTNHQFLPIWLGLVVSRDYLFILHNPSYTLNRHALVSVHEMDGTEIAVLDVSTFLELPDGYSNDIRFPWFSMELVSEGRDGVFVYSQMPYFVKIDGNLEMSRVNITGVYPLGLRDVSSGWDGYFYRLNQMGDRIIQVNPEIGQYFTLVNPNDQLEEFGVYVGIPLGADQGGKIFFTLYTGEDDSYRGYIGRYDSQTNELLIANRDLTLSNGLGNYLGGDYVITPSGTILAFDSTNWPESRELLRCEFVPLP
jgi:hypothetical protein